MILSTNGCMVVLVPLAGGTTCKWASCFCTRLSGVVRVGWKGGCCSLSFPVLFSLSPTVILSHLLILPPECLHLSPHFLDYWIVFVMLFLAVELVVVREILMLPAYDLAPDPPSLLRFHSSSSPSSLSPCATGESFPSTPRWAPNVPSKYPDWDFGIPKLYNHSICIKCYYSLTK